ncbi:vWA domain-containing protein [Ktedonospora formicarum]|uniref:VWFA domain-containing protein n=1 Tax=Ktedonospora formicarum TaxID=2778364 RepID=A0A8J3I2F1_9CHLR|nr:vWA domain-containing protein [Ktedonospora formicarum]GHO45540.1 hypothetical protein KSX_37030 [Ktedonospora formicarum]
MAETQEHDIRAQILNTFLMTPHRKLGELAPLHTDALERDPLFYGHLAPWYFKNGEVRDHRVLFIAHLATSDYPEFREVAWVLLQQLAPYEVSRVLDHAKKVVGKVPRSLKGAIEHYLRQREENPRQFDGAAMRARSDLKHLYASLRIKPGPRAQATLFERRPPEDSTLAVLKKLAKAEDVQEQALLILENKIPYTTAIGAVKQITPALLVALIISMSPQEVINNMAMLKRRGAMDNAEVKALIEEKLTQATSDKRVSTMKAKKAASVAKLDESSTRLLNEVTNKRVASKVEVKRPTALLVDKSSSMTQAIDVSKQIAALVSSVISAEFRVYAFDSAAFEVKVSAPEKERPELSDWDQAFKFIKANGSTSIGAGVAKMRADNFRAEMIVVVTDGGENTAPTFNAAYDQYVETLKSYPSVIIVEVGYVTERFEKSLREHGIEVMNYRFNGDYYSLPNLLPLLNAATRAELVDLIMSQELPQHPKPLQAV